ncbi:MAG: 30S ribosomal protein S20 [Chloroflexota bacterium]
MANISSQIKRNRQNEKRRLRNRTFRGAARTAVKNARAAIAGGGETQAEMLAAIRVLDRAAGKGILHPRNAARRKSRLMKALNRAMAQPAIPAAEKKTRAAKPKVEAVETVVEEPKAKKVPAKKAAEPKVAKKAAEKKPAARKPAAKK